MACPAIQTRPPRHSRHSPRPMCHSEAAMRDPETIETDLVEIAAIPDDLVKLERIIAWCASHPDEVPFAIHQLMSRHHPPPKPRA